MTKDVRHTLGLNVRYILIVRGARALQNRSESRVLSVR